MTLTANKDALFNDVLAILTRELNKNWLSNPELVDIILKEGVAQKGIPEICFIDNTSKKMKSMEISEYKKGLVLDPNKLEVFLVHLEYGDNRQDIFEAKFYHNNHWRSYSSSYTNEKTKPSIMVESIYHEEIVKDLVYDTRKVYDKITKIKDETNALKHKDIYVGSIIKNIVIHSHKALSIEITSIEESEFDGWLCKGKMKKRGKNSIWEMSVNPRALVVAIHNRDKLKEFRTKIKIDMTHNAVEEDGSINSQSVLF